MAPVPTDRSFRNNQLFIWLSVIVNCLHLWVSTRWPDSVASVLTFWAMSATFLAWFGYKSWTGYLRRRPYWTRDPGAATCVLPRCRSSHCCCCSVELWLFDVKGSRLVFGEARSGLRTIWILVDLGLMGFVRDRPRRGDQLAGRGRAVAAVHQDAMVPLALAPLTTHT